MDVLLTRWYSSWLIWYISPWGPCAPPCSRWSFSAPRGRSFHPSTPSIRSLCMEQANLQVLGLHPVDVMAPHALPHHLDKRQSHSYEIPKQDLQRRRPGSWRRQRWRREAECRRGASTSPRSQSPDHDFVVTFSLRFDLFLPASPSLSCSWTCHACPSSRGGRWPSSAWTGASCSTGEGWLTVCLVQFRFGRLHFLPWRDRICLIFTGLFLSGFVGVFAEKPWSPTKIVEPTRLRESWGTN